MENFHMVSGKLLGGFGSTSDTPSHRIMHEFAHENIRTFKTGSVGLRLTEELWCTFLNVRNHYPPYRKQAECDASISQCGKLRFD